MTKIIGLVGGMGTYAGIDLLKKIADNTDAGNDSEHLPVAMLSLPGRITDRSEYLFGQVDENPGYAIAEVIKKLNGVGATIFGLPCNTAHVPEILRPVLEGMPEGCKLVNMIGEVADYISIAYPDINNIGILGTNGVYKSRVYDDYLTGAGLSILYPDEEVQYRMVHPAIYDMEYGIKAMSEPVSMRAAGDLMSVAGMLITKGAQLIVMGCTEIPLAVTTDNIKGVPLVDAGDILAKALVREAKA